MAYGDTYNEGDDTEYVYAPKTAQQNAFVAEHGEEDRLHREDKARAEAAGVTGVDKIDYAEALRNYESRSDVEPFANRRAREYADAFEDQDFARRAVQEAGPLQSSTVGTTTVVAGDDYTDAEGLGGTDTDTDGDGPDTDTDGPVRGDGRDDVVVDPNA